MKPPPSLLFSFSFPLFFIVISGSAAYISPGSTIYASNPNQTWTSPNNTFSLRFIADSSDSYFAAITFNGIPVWKAGAAEDSGGVADSSASFHFLSDGNLRLVNGSSGDLVWESNTAGHGISSAALDDSGNFVLRNGTVSVWSTFDHPTDTILPSQNFTTRNVLRSGLYSFRLLSSGNLTLQWNDSVLYWNLGLNSSFNTNLLTSPNLVLQSTGALSLSDQFLSSSVVMVYSSDYAEGRDILRFLRLENDGNLRIYSSAKGRGTSIVRWVAVSDQCQVFGYCGSMGICSYNGTNPICLCPSLNFDRIDPKDSRKGCKRKMNIEDCPGNLAMLQLNHTKFLTYPPDIPSQIFFMSTSTSRLTCFYSSPCIASTSLSDGTGRIYMKFPGFISGYHSPTLPSTSFLKVCGPILPLSLAMHNDWRLHARMILVVVIGTILGFVLLEGGLWFWCYRSRSPKFGGFPDQYAFLNYDSHAPVEFSYKELQYATKGFKEKLGEGGGFGAAYRGVIANGTVVAVKQLEGIVQGERQFKMEVAIISSTHHLNLVRLIGFCSIGRHRLLVYEFIKNKSLDNFLFPLEQSGNLLNWDCRFNIALGTARGIAYLHEECRKCIVHCDIKPENILLDENFNAKVSDFGLARLINPRNHRYQILTSFRGTGRGYLAPEWLANLPITSKADVYSYGMVLLEIVSGRRNFEVSSIETNGKKLCVWAYEMFESEKVVGIVDTRLANDYKVDMEQVMRVIQVSFWCIQEQPSQRPTMGKVVQMLEGIVEIEKPPAPKAVAEVSVNETIVNGRSNFSPLSDFAASEPASSPSSSIQTLSFVSGWNGKRASSSLLQSRHKRSSDC